MNAYEHSTHVHNVAYAYRYAIGQKTVQTVRRYDETVALHCGQRDRLVACAIAGAAAGAETHCAHAGPKRGKEHKSIIQNTTGHVWLDGAHIHVACACPSVCHNFPAGRPRYSQCIWSNKWHTRANTHTHTHRIVLYVRTAGSRHRLHLRVRFKPAGSSHHNAHKHTNGVYTNMQAYTYDIRQ